MQKSIVTVVVLFYEQVKTITIPYSQVSHENIRSIFTVYFLYNTVRFTEYTLRTDLFLQFTFV